MKYFFGLAILCMLAGCKKFLEAKPSAALVVPSTLTDVQALLDYYPKINNNDAGFSDVGTDDYYISSADFNSLTEPGRRSYTWANYDVMDPVNNDWSATYERVNYCNVAIESVDKIETTSANQAQWNNVRGQAVFSRAAAFFAAAVIWVPVYDSASTALGLPLRLSSDFNIPSVRSSLQETYSRIVSDAKEAVALLPTAQVQKTRPSKAAAYALLSRIYLSMRKYDLAFRYADSALQLNSSLIDYNTLSTTANYPFALFNAEVLFHSMIGYEEATTPSIARIDSNLVKSYAANDLRRTLYFKTENSGVSFKGCYDGNIVQFSGPTTREMYLIRSECYARAGNVAGALTDLNTLMVKRWKTGTFVPFTAPDAPAALATILRERRKELVFNCLRWMDLKRLNKEGAGISLTRVANNQTYTLPPNDPRYAVAIPQDVIDFTGMPQNPR